MKKILIPLFCLAIVFAMSGLVFAESIELTVQTYWDPDEGGGEVLVGLLEEYEEQNPEIKIEYVYVPFGELLTTILRQTLTGTLPEVVFADNPDIRHLAEAGVFLDLTERVEVWGEWDDFFMGPQYANTLDDRVYALQMVTNNLALYYNKGMFEEAGIEAPPQTWAELMDVCEILDEVVDAYPIGFCADNTEAGTWQFQPFLWSNRGNLLELDSGESIEALQLWVDLVEKGYASRDVMTWEQGDVGTHFAGGRLAMMVNGPWEMATSLADTDVNFGISSIPVPEEGLAPVVAMGGESFGIGSTIDPAKEDAAWDLLRYLVSPETMARQNLGSFTIPTRGAAVETVLEEQPLLESFIEQAEFAVSRPLVGGGEDYPTVSAATREAFQRALAGDMTAEETFRHAAEEIRGLFDTMEEYEEARQEAESILEEIFAEMLQ